MDDLFSNMEADREPSFRPFDLKAGHLSFRFDKKILDRAEIARSERCAVFVTFPMSRLEL